MKSLYLMLVVMAITGCDGSPAVDAVDNTGKNLFSSWVDSSGLIIDLSHAHFGSGTIDWIVSSGEICRSTYLLAGDQHEGNASLTATAYISGGAGVDPGCASLNSSYTYTKTDTVLTFCDSTHGGCYDYH